MTKMSRRSFAVASLVAGASVAASGADAAEQGDISLDNAAIHQELVFHAKPARVYRILTTDEFDKVVQLSAAMGAMKSMHGARPTVIDSRPGGAFSFFGGYITGQNIELVPDTRLVQVWRSASWDAGSYSIVRFGLVAQGDDTQIVFDHTGFPNADAAHLAKGWHGNYWQPLAKVLAQ